MPLIGAPAIAQGWPNKPIKFVVSYPPGGATDIFARAYGDYISKQLGQTVVVENKAGAGGTVGAVEVKRSPADGYTLLFTISTTMIMNKVLYKNLPYDPDKDFVLISYMPAGSLPTDRRHRAPASPTSTSSRNTRARTRPMSAPMPQAPTRTSSSPN